MEASEHKMDKEGEMAQEQFSLTVDSLLSQTDKCYENKKSSLKRRKKWISMVK